MIDLAHWQTVLAAHWHAVLWVAAVWIALGNVLATRWQIPARTAPWYVRVAHFVLVNLPHYGAALRGRSVFGLPFDFPVLSWTLRLADALDAPKEEPTAAPPRGGQGGFVSVSTLLLIGLIACVGLAFLAISSVLSGCAPTEAYVVALKAESLAANTYVDSYEAWRRTAYLHQEQIRSGASSREDGAVKLAAWRAVRDGVDAKFSLLRDAIKAYAAALAAGGAARESDYGAAAAGVIAAIADLAQALKDAGVDVPLPKVSLPLRPGNSPPARWALATAAGGSRYAR